MLTPYYDDAESGIKIFHDDCRDVIPYLPPGSIDLLLTDPPYASGARRDAERQVRGAMLRSLEHDDWFSHDAMTSWGFQWFMRSVLTQLQPVLTVGSHLYIFTDWRQTPNIYGMLESCGYRVNQCLVWAKPHYGMGSYWRNQHENIVFGSLGMPTEMRSHGAGSVLTYPSVPSAQRIHPTEKPLDLLKAILLSAPGTSLIDPFMGSGVTLEAAKILGIGAIGIDVDEHNCELAVKRLRQNVLPFSYKKVLTQSEIAFD